MSIKVKYITSHEGDGILEQELNILVEDEEADIVSIHTRSNDIWVIIYDEFFTEPLREGMD